MHSRWSIRKISYRLFVPRDINDNELYPLIIWFHGFKEKGNDTIQNLKWIDQLILTNAKQPERYRFFLLVLQIPENERVWHHNQLQPEADPESIEPDMLHCVIKVMDALLSKYPIDPNKIVASGVSMGGGACWEIGIRYPERFAGIAPISMSGGVLSAMCRLKDTPVWAFNCDHDNESPLYLVNERIAAINSSGGDARLTIINSDKHDAWTAAFQKYHLLDWLLAQDRSKLTSLNKPSVAFLFSLMMRMLENWTSYQLLAQICVVTSFTILISIIIRAFLRKTSTFNSNVKSNGDCLSPVDYFQESEGD